MLTTVINLRKAPPGWRNNSRYVYIGRANRYHRLPQSPFANPFRLVHESDRKEVVDQYEEWIKSQPDLVQKAIDELSGKILVCYCHPKLCHGDVLARICNERLAA